MSNELSKYINILFLIGLGICLTILLIFQEHYFARNLRFLLSHAALPHHPDSGGGSGAICFTLCFKGLAQQHQFQSYSTKSMRSHGIL